MKVAPVPLESESLASIDAAAWFARQRMAPLSAQRTVEFEAWLKADATHAAAWSELERVWSHVDAIRNDPRILAMREQARNRIDSEGQQRILWHGAVALAAVLLMAVALWWIQQKSPVANGNGTILAHTSPGSETALPLIREASTQIGERSTLALADGSTVTLNTASAVRADYSGTERRLTLIRGEAFFDVAKDPTRPFVVTAGSRQVIAVGTAFNVRLQGRRVRVILVEGKVRVVHTAPLGASVTSRDEEPPAVTMTAGSAFVADDKGSGRLEAVDASRATSWRSGKLVFDGERLGDVVAEMNRYSRETLKIADRSLENRKVSGVFEPTEGHSFAKALEDYRIVRARQVDATTIVLETP
jgi:transmembrane sensor